MLWKHLWERSDWRWLEDRQDQSVSEGTEVNFTSTAFLKEMNFNTVLILHQDFHDTVLELARDKALNEKALIIQKVLRGYKYR